MDLERAEAVLLEHAPGAAPRYKVSQRGRFFGWLERRGAWWYGDTPERQRLPGRHRRRRDALERLTHVSPP